MNKIHLLIVTLGLSATAAFAQNTYPWPAFGNVGIGNTNPSVPLDVSGSMVLRESGYAALNNSDNTNQFYFRNEGTSGSNGAVLTLGCTNQGEVLRVLKSGNVGIGTTNPDAKLDVRGNGYFGTYSGAQVSIGNSGTEYPSIGFNIAYTGTGNLWNYRVGDAASLLRFHQGGFQFKVAGAGAQGGAIDFTDAMAITGSGNIGIGTTSPARKLDVTGDAHISSLLVTPEWYGNIWYSSNTNPMYIGDGTDGDRHVTILNNGNVGIGTTNPTEKLAVNGKIRAKEVVVDTNWSDYVFAKDYKLAPLSEVEQHIQQQGHLPGVPSAAEVAEKGVSVGDIQAVLLAKLEEVTLHLIAQEKELSALRTELTTLKAASALLK